jgi:hypothetical protein
LRFVYPCLPHHICAKINENKLFFIVAELNKCCIFALNINTKTNTMKNTVNASGYIELGKLGPNDQFLGRRSLSYTLSTDLGFDPKNEFGGGDWLGFDGVALYASGGKKEGTILYYALTYKYSYGELKAAAAEFFNLTM